MKLTDEEILKACDSTKWIAPEGLALDIGRAIEAAVLAQGDMSHASTHGKNVSMKQGFENMKQEPVAWMWKDGTITSDPDRADGTWTPLYAAPVEQRP